MVEAATIATLPPVNPFLFTDKVRPFPKWPMMCSATNRPAHESKQAARDYLTRIAMAGKLKRIWQCDKCQLWHHECKT